MEKYKQLIIQSYEDWQLYGKTKTVADIKPVKRKLYLNGKFGEPKQLKLWQKN